eukprot:12899738-Prorocentrum_lima.AAC.1
MVCADNAREDRQRADDLAARFLSREGAISRADVTAVLSAWGLCPNTSRQNILQEGDTYVYSDTFGL